MLQKGVGSKREVTVRGRSRRGPVDGRGYTGSNWSGEGEKMCHWIRGRKVVEGKKGEDKKRWEKRGKAVVRGNE